MSRQASQDLDMQRQGAQIADTGLLREDRGGNKQFSHIGVMLDSSRNGTLSIPFLRHAITEMAYLGIDRLYLYMEDVYTIEGEPCFGAFRGRYTKEELIGLDEFALRHGVEIIPCIQTLAHLHTFLRWPSAAPSYIFALALCRTLS